MPFFDDLANLQARLRLDNAQFVRAARESDRELDKLERRAPRTARSLGGLGTAFKAVAAAVSVRELARFSKATFDLGASVEETANKFQQVFGDAGDEVDAFIDDFGRLAGVTEREGRDLLATTGGIARGMGFATDAASDFAQEIFTVAGDLASFNNLPVEDTLLRINAALTGERESLKRLGVVIRETEVQQRALVETGKESVDAITQQEKAAATLNLILEKTSFATGDLERTQDSAANAARRLASAGRQLREDFAVGFVQALGDVGQTLSDTSDDLNELRSAAQTAGRAFVAFGRIIGNVVALTGDAIAGMIAGVGKFVVDTVNVAVDAINLLLPKVAELARLDAEFFDERLNRATRNFGKNATDLADALGQLVDAEDDVASAFMRLGPTLEQLTGEGGDGNLPTLTEEIQNVEVAVSDLADAWRELQRRMTRTVAPRAFQDLETPLEDMVEPARDLAETLPEATIELTSIEQALLDAAQAGGEFGLNIDEADDNLQEFLSRAADMAQVATFVLDTARAFGILGDEASGASRAIEGAVRGAALGASIPGAGVVGAAAGGALGFLGGIFGGGPSPAEQFRRQFDAMIALLRINNDRLREIAQGVIARGVTPTELAALQTVALPGGFSVAFDEGLGDLQRAIEETGLSLLDLRNIAGEFGLDISEFIKVMTTGRGDVELAFEQFEALQDSTALLSDEQLQAAHAAADLARAMDEAAQDIRAIDVQAGFGLLGLREQFRALLNILQNLPGVDVTALGLANLDLSTQAGVRAAIQAVQAIIQQAFNPGRGQPGGTGPRGFPTLGVPGAAFDPDTPAGRQAGRVLQDMFDLLQQIEATFGPPAGVGGGTRAPGGGVSDAARPSFVQRSIITEVQGSELVALNRTQLVRLEQMVGQGDRRDRLIADLPSNIADGVDIKLSDDIERVLP